MVPPRGLRTLILTINPTVFSNPAGELHRCGRLALEQTEQDPRGFTCCDLLRAYQRSLPSSPSEAEALPLLSIRREGTGEDPGLSCHPRIRVPQQ